MAFRETFGKEALCFTAAMFGKSKFCSHDLLVKNVNEIGSRAIFFSSKVRCEIDILRNLTIQSKAKHLGIPTKILFKNESFFIAIQNVT